MSQFEKIAKIAGKRLSDLFVKVWKIFFVKKLKTTSEISPKTHKENNTNDDWKVKRYISFQKDGCLWVGEEFENGSSWRGTECLDCPESTF